MIVNTLFNIGQFVYFLFEGKIVRQSIVSIQTFTKLFNDAASEQSIEYQFQYYDGPIWIHEDKVFATAEELAEKLIEEVDDLQYQ